MKETNINDLTTQLSEEESNIVDSIINDLNKDIIPSKNMNHPSRQTPEQILGQIPGQVPGQIPGQVPGQIPGQIPGQVPRQEPFKVPVTPEQKKMLDTMNYDEQQKFLRELRIKNNLQNSPEILDTEKIKEIKGNIIKDLKNSIKEPILISLLSFIFSMPQINYLFLLTKSNIFINDTGDITIISLLIKALLVGIIYYLIKIYNIV